MIMSNQKRDDWYDMIIRYDDMQLYAHSTLIDAVLYAAVASKLHVSLTSVSGVHHAGCSSAMLNQNWYGLAHVPRCQSHEAGQSDCSLLVGGNTIKLSTTLRDLGVLLDSELSLNQHVNKVVSCCYYHIRRLLQVSHCDGQDWLTVLRHISTEKLLPISAKKRC